MKLSRPQFSLGSALLFMLFISALVMSYLGRKSWVLEKTMTFGAEGSYIEGLSPDGKMLFTILRPNTTPPNEGKFATQFKVWDIENCRQINEFAHPGDVGVLRFSADGKRILSRGSEALCIWDLANGKQLASLEHVSGLVTFSDDGSHLYLNYDGVHSVLHVSLEGNHSKLVVNPERNSWSHSLFLPDTRHVIVWCNELLPEIRTSNPGDDPREKMLLLDAQSLVKVGEVNLPLRGADLSHLPVCGADLSPDRTRLLITLNDAVQIWDAQSLKVLRSIKAESWPPASYSPDGKSIMIGCSPLAKEVWDANLQTCFGKTEFLHLNGGRSFKIEHLVAIQIMDLYGTIVAEVPLVLFDLGYPQMHAFDGKAVITDLNRIHVIRRRFPEYWWGQFARPEVWLAILFGAAWGVRVWRGRRVA